MAFHIRSSKFRHVYGDPYKKEKCYENIRLTRNAHDSNFCTVNPSFIAVVTESAGGGAFVVLPLGKTGRIDINTAKVCGHSGGVLDIKWNPFNDHIIASGSEDSTVKIWQIPEKGLRGNLTDWQVDLHGHGRRVGYIDWHPTAENIILSAGLDYKCIIWNVEQAEPVNIIDCHPDVIQSIGWNREGSLFCTTCKDKNLRIIDPRAGTCVGVSENVFISNRPIKGVFLGDTGRVFCTGFNSFGERESAMWDIRKLNKELTRRRIDSSNGIMIPFYDHDTKIIYLAGKGDGCIRYYEITDESPYDHYLNSFGSSSPQRGLGVMPKRGLDASRCEIMRFYKLHAARNYVEPISMIVPRKSNQFHDDIFTPTASTIASLTADEWISGQNREPILISMKDKHVVNDPSFTPSCAVQHQHVEDGALNQAPTITTYKAVNSRPQSMYEMTSSGSSSSAKVMKAAPTKTPASLRNIRQLSTSQDIITLAPSQEVPSKESQKECPKKEEEEEKEVGEEKPDTSTEKAFVNSKIAAFERQVSSTGSSNNNNNESPTRHRFSQRSGSSSQENPPDLIANGIKASDESSSNNRNGSISSSNKNNSSNGTLSGKTSSFNIQNAALFFEHREIEIIDKKQPIKPESAIETQNVAKVTKHQSLDTKSSNTGKLILGDITEDRNTANGHKVHVKKTWSPVKPVSNPTWEEVTSVPSTDPELRKAYFQQVAEIKALKEQLALKDKRIRQLEDEVLKGKSEETNESNC